MTRFMSPYSFFLCFICINSFLLATAQEEAAAVLDGYGNKLEVGSQYYMKSAITGSGGGGVSIGYSGVQRCPLTVFQEIVDVQDGIPVSFQLANPKDHLIRISSSLNIKFETRIKCASSTVWQVGKYDKLEELYPILIGGVQGDPGCNTLANWFKIERGDSDKTYKIMFDPTDVCSFAKGGNHIGTFFEEGKRPLALNGSAFNVKFWKYEISKHYDTFEL